MRILRLVILIILVLLPLQLSALVIYFNNYFFSFENADFQSYDASVFRENQVLRRDNSDDSYKLFYGELRFYLNEEYKNTIFHIDASRFNLWGADNFQGGDDGHNTFSFSKLYFGYAISENSQLKLGRHKYEIGNAHYDYFFSDIIDGFSFKHYFSDFMALGIMGDVLSNSVRNEETGVYGISTKDDEKLDDFRGDTISTRVGFKLSFRDFSQREIQYQVKEPHNTNLSRRRAKAKRKSKRVNAKNKGKSDFLSKFGLSLFAYHLSYAANTQGGADLSENGKNYYNKADGDFLNLSGIRFDGTFLENSLKFDFTWAYSLGVDFQFNDEHRYQDHAWSLNLVWEDNFRDLIKNEFCISLSSFASNFAAMKGTSMGGMLLWGYKSYFAAPYASAYHFRDYAKYNDVPQLVDRTTAKSFFKLEDEISWLNYSISLALLRLWETEQMKYMGTELELSFAYKLENISFTSRVAIFRPGEYYENYPPEPYLEQSSGFIANSLDDFYGFHFGVSYLLDFDELSVYKKLNSKSKIKIQNKKIQRFNYNDSGRDRFTD